jgi:lipopolysaccharide export system protein LptA
VKLTSRGDTVRGQWAVYDVTRKIVTLGGNVELQQGDTVVKGDRLELDLASGKSRIQGLDSTGGEQRVRGEFTPVSSDSGEGN